MLSLKKSLFIGQGLHRACYHHPENDGLCVKVVVAEGGAKESAREEMYYQHLAKTNVFSKSIPKFYGIIETNLGKGSIFELVRSEDGEVSSSLETVLHHQRVSNNLEEEQSIRRGLNQLRKELVQSNIITMTLHPKNILCKKNQKNFCRLVVIDNIGNSDWLPVCNYCKPLAKRKIVRKWNRFQSLLSLNYGFSMFDSDQMQHDRSVKLSSVNSRC